MNKYVLKFMLMDSNLAILFMDLYLFIPISLLFSYLMHAGHVELIDLQSEMFHFLNSVSDAVLQNFLLSS